MDGGGRSSKLTRRTNRWPPTTRKIAWGVTFPQDPLIGSMFRVIRFSLESKRCEKEKSPMRPYLVLIVATVGLIAATFTHWATSAVIAQAPQSTAVFDSEG